MYPMLEVSHHLNPQVSHKEAVIQCTQRKTLYPTAFLNRLLKFPQIFHQWLQHRAPRRNRAALGAWREPVSGVLPDGLIAVLRARPRREVLPEHLGAALVRGGDSIAVLEETAVVL
uniref:Uncharacterized protein n=1 Tax=Arundo donax TaxID=35708 RepID=A0A0A9CS97_ARUDO